MSKLLNFQHDTMYFYNAGWDSKDLQPLLEFMLGPFGTAKDHNYEVRCICGKILSNFGLVNM